MAAVPECGEVPKCGEVPRGADGGDLRLPRRDPTGDSAYSPSSYSVHSCWDVAFEDGDLHDRMRSEVAEVSISLTRYKALLIRAAAFLLWLVEATIHWRCGFSKRTYEDEGRCSGLPSWRFYLVVCEGVCRSGFVVAFAGFLWDTGIAAWHGAIGPFLEKVFTESGEVAGHWSAQLIKKGLMSLTFGVGFCLLFVRESAVPEWVALYGHLCDIGCHTVVTTALVGLLTDFCAAILSEDLPSLAMNFLCCRDYIEAHGVKADEAPNPQVWSDSEPHHEVVVHHGWTRAIFMWMLFVITLWCYLLDEGGGALPPCAATSLEACGMLCWVGIVGWLVDQARVLDLAHNPAADGTSISNLVMAQRPRYHRPFRRTSSCPNFTRSPGGSPLTRDRGLSRCISDYTLTSHSSTAGAPPRTLLADAWAADDCQQHT